MQGCTFSGSENQSLTFTLPFSQQPLILGPILYSEIFSPKTALTFVTADPLAILGAFLTLPETKSSTSDSGSERS